MILAKEKHSIPWLEHGVKRRSNEIDHSGSQIKSGAIEDVGVTAGLVILSSRQRDSELLEGLAS